MPRIIAPRDEGEQDDGIEQIGNEGIPERRCGELDRPLENLPYRPDDADDFNWNDEEREERIEQDHELARRWFAPLPWPRWL